MDERIRISEQLKKENNAIYNYTTTSYYINNPCDENNAFIQDMIQVSPTTYYYFEAHNLTCESYKNYMEISKID